MEILKNVESVRNHCRLKQWSYSTEKNYCNAVKNFLLKFQNEKEPKAINDSQIEKYLLEFTGRSNRCTNHSAIKLFYKINGQPNKLRHTPYPEKEDKLPVHVTKEDFIKLISACENIKHKCILMLGYDAGLRVSEIIELKITDIDSQLMQINVRQSKGRKDRKVKLSSVMLNFLRQYYKEWKPVVYLFNGQGDLAQYSIRSCQQIIKTACEKSGLNKKYSIHKLRHGFAMALLENRVELDDIREYLGHSYIKTARIYARMDNRMIQRNQSPLEILVNSNITSPLQIYSHA